MHVVDSLKNDLGSFQFDASKHGSPVDYLLDLLFNMAEIVQLSSGLWWECYAGMLRCDTVVKVSMNSIIQNGT